MRSIADKTKKRSSGGSRISGSRQVLERQTAQFVALQINQNGAKRLETGA
jgi:hypothetical protein